MEGMAGWIAEAAPLGAVGDAPRLTGAGFNVDSARTGVLHFTR